MNADGKCGVAQQVASAVRCILARVLGIYDKRHLAWIQKAARDRGFLVAKLAVEAHRAAGVVVARGIEKPLEQVTQRLGASGPTILQQAADAERPTARRL